MNRFLILLIFVFGISVRAQDVDILKPQLEKPIREYPDQPNPTRFDLSVLPGVAGTPTKLTIRVDCKYLPFEQIGPNWLGGVVFNIHIVGETTDGYLEGIETTERETADLLDTRKCLPFLIERRVQLASGRYRLEVIVKNRLSSKPKKKKLKFRVDG